MANYNEKYYNAAGWYYCPKCNSKEHKTTYCKDTQIVPDPQKGGLMAEIKSEWLTLTCSHCGFSWTMEPFDRRPDYQDLER